MFNDLQTQIDTFIGKLKSKLPINAKQGDPLFVSTYKIDLDMNSKCRVYLSFYEGGIRGPGHSIDPNIPTAYREHSSLFIAAARSFLETQGYVDYKSENLNTLISHSGEEGKEKRINSAVKQLAAEVDFLPKNISIVQDGLNGMYILPEQQRTSIVLRPSVSPFINGIWEPNRILKSITIPPIDYSHISEYKTALRAMLENECALTPTDIPLSEANIERWTNGLLTEAIHKFPNEFAGVLDGEQITRGTITTSLHLPPNNEEKKNIFIKVGLRPLSDHIARNERYIQIPAPFLINTNTRDVTWAKHLEKKLQECFARYGFEHYLYSKAEKGRSEVEKEIPKDWIDVENIRLNTTGNEIFNIIVVKPSGRRAQIRWSTGTRDAARAEEMHRVLCKDLLPLYLSGEKANEPLTLAAIVEYMQERFEDQKTPSRSCVKRDIRTIMSGDVPIMTLNTPGCRSEFGSYVCVLRMVPPHSKTTLKRMAIHSLNTSNRVYAQQLTKFSQMLAEIILTNYFKSHPGLTLVTERDDKGHDIFKIPAPGGQPPENKLFLRTLIDQEIIPAFKDFSRYINWDSKIERLNDGRYEIDATIRRNAHSEILPDTISPLQHFNVYAADQETAENFCKALEEKIISSQYMFSRERAVEHFGQNSMRLSIRESLRAALIAFPTIETPDTHVFQTLLGRLR